MCYNLEGRMNYMRIYDGNKFDSTNRKTDKFLKVNSCGFQKQEAGYTVIRQTGRIDYHLLLLTKGELKVVYKENTHILHAGGLVLYEPNVSQYYETLTETNTLWLHFAGTAVKEILKDADIVPGVYASDCTSSLNDSFLELIRNFSYSGTENYIPGLLLILLARLSDLTPKQFQTLSHTSIKTTTRSLL